MSSAIWNIKKGTVLFFLFFYFFFFKQKSLKIGNGQLPYVLHVFSANVCFFKLQFLKVHII